MKLSSRKELLKEASLLLKEIKKSLNEDLGSFKKAGIPDEFSKYLLRTLAFKHDSEIETMTAKPKASDLKSGVIFINVISPTEVRSIFKGGSDLYYRIDYSESTGAKTTSYASNLKNALSGIGTGKYFRIRIPLSVINGFARKAKLTPDQVKSKSTADALAGSDENIYGYMNDVFMKGLKPKLESMIDDIFNNLRKMSTAKNKAGYKSEQQSALDDAEMIQSIIDNGFNRNNMEQFLSTLNKKKYKPATGFGSIPQNEKKLKDVLKNVPNARAKWAKVVLDMATELHKKSMELINKANK
jgi:hypothetical protein